MMNKYKCLPVIVFSLFFELHYIGCQIKVYVSLSHRTLSLQPALILLFDYNCFQLWTRHSHYTSSVSTLEAESP